MRIGSFCTLLGIVVAGAAHAQPPPSLGALTTNGYAGNNLHGTVELYDPAQPLSAANPFQIDGGVTFNYGSIGRARTLRSARVEDGIEHDLDSPLMVYLKDDQVFRVDLRAGADHTPRAVGAARPSCYLSGQALDLQNPERSWIAVWSAGPDGTCRTEDDIGRFLQVSTGPADPGIALGPGDFLSGIQGSHGELVGFLTVRTHRARPDIIQLDAQAAHPRHLAYVDPADPGFERRQFSFDSQWLAFRAPGDGARSLRRLVQGPDGPQLSRVLYRFEGDPGEDTVSRAVSDGRALFFGDGHRLIRLPLTARHPEQVRILALSPEDRTIQDVRLGGRRTPNVIFTTRPGRDPGTVFSVAKDGSSRPTPLADDAYVFAVAGRFVYAYDLSGSLRLADDGSSRTGLPGTFFLQVVDDNDQDLAPLHSVSPQRIVLMNQDDQNRQVLRYLNLRTGALGCRLGALPPNVGAFTLVPWNVGRIVGIEHYGDSDSSFPSDNAFFFDTQVCNSLVGAAKTRDVSEDPVEGF